MTENNIKPLAIRLAKRTVSRYDLHYTERAQIAQELVRLSSENSKLRVASAKQAELETILDFVANQSCEAHTGRKWLDLDDEEKGFWRNEARTQAGEWSSEVAYHAKGRAETSKRN